MHKRFRVVIDIDATMLDLTVERIRETRRQMAQTRRVEWPATSFDDEINETLLFSVPTEEDLQPQRQLVELLLASPDTLDFFLKREVEREIESGVFTDCTFEVTDESLLQPLINRLPPAEREHFQYAMSRDEFYDSVEDLYDAIQTEIVSVTLAEVRVAQ